MTTQQAFDLALQHHQAGRLADAEMLYRQILAVQPNHVDALHFLGVIANQAGRHDLAVEWIRQAIVLNPNNAAAYSNLGEAYRATGWLDEAVAACRRALQLKPDFPEAHNSLGNVLRERGQFDEAVAEYRLALELKPDSPEVCNNLGIALAAQGRLDEAVAAFDRALGLNPNYPDAWINLSGTLTEQGQFDKAVDACRHAVLLKPDSPTAHNNLGRVLWERGQLDEALTACHRALQLKSDFPEAWNNLGIALADQGRLDDAVTAYRRALDPKPGYPKAWNNLGIALTEQDQLDEAVAAYRQALHLKPDYPEAYLNLGNALTKQGQLDEAMAAYRQAIDLKPANAIMLSNLVYAMHYSPACEVRSVRVEQARWNRLYVDPLRPGWRPHGNDPDPRRRLKIGYLSPDFYSHTVSFFLAPLFEAHDRREDEIYCYASVRRPDAVTERLRKSANVWRDVRALSDVQLAECVRDDGIDILVDLSMHTGNNRLPLFAHKPAPVQVSWLAYAGSTGLETIDYRLTDAIIDPAGQDDEGPGGKAVRLPDCWCCYKPIEEFPPVGPLPAEHKGTVTFGSLNQFAKLHDGHLDCWARLLGTVPASRLLMICPKGRARERTLALFAAHGIARDRVELVAPCPWPDYTRLFEKIDLALDSFPCNGMTTTCHTLWMGVPVVTRVGTTAVSCAGSSLLHAVGLHEWVAQSEEEYIRIAAAWAGDLPRLAELRRTLRSRMEASPLMDAPRFARNIEAAYRTMWQTWCTDHLSPAR